MNDRIYLDYNSTSPFSKSLLSYLGKGDFPFANPSSIHSSGKQARKVINETTEFLRQTFGVKEDRAVVYTSGSTESMSSFFQMAGPGDSVFYCRSDHPAMLSIVDDLSSRGIACHSLSIDGGGNLKLDEALEKMIAAAAQGSGRVFLNYTVVHNETGVYWPLADACLLKKEAGAIVHVDATQLPGKVRDWQRLESALDAYSFSAHKFGAFKGVGFLFLKKELPYEPLFKGGGQQDGRRGGTENALGIHSIKLALADTLNSDLDAIESLRDRLQAITLERSDTLVAGLEAKSARAVNTLNFILKNKKADIALIHFDLLGLDVSSGSACSAGSVRPSETLIEMGYRDLARNGIRVSLGQESLEREEEILSRFREALSKL